MIIIITIVLNHAKKKIYILKAGKKNVKLDAISQLTLLVIIIMILVITNVSKNVIDII